MDCALHSCFKQRPEPATQLSGQDWFECSTPGQGQIRLATTDLTFPFAAFERRQIPACFDRLNVAAAYSPHAQHYSLLAQLVLASIEINRDFGAWAPFERPQKRTFLKLGNTG